MLCQFAIDDIEALEAKGLHPSPADIVRLNSLGLIAQAARNCRAASSLDYLPRVAMISDTISFRQPTVGHDIWLAKVMPLVSDDAESAVAVHAYALSRPHTDLVDPLNLSAVRDAVAAFAEKCADYTRDQISAAVHYALYGANPCIGEYPYRGADDSRLPDGTEGEDWRFCLSLGILNEGRIVLFGMNQAEMESMTRRQLEDAISRAYFFHHMERRDPAEKAVNEYYATLSAIEERLTQKNGEKAHENG